jgi:hypothetical protein
MKNEKNMHSSLNDRPRKNAFVVPEDYFEELPTAVLLKCSVSKVEKVTLLKSKPLWWSVAACGLLLLGIWFVVPNSTPSSDFLLAEEMYTISELQDYLAYHVPSAVIEEELFDLDANFAHFFEDFFDDELLDVGELLDYLSYNHFSYE